MLRWSFLLADKPAEKHVGVPIGSPASRLSFLTWPAAGRRLRSDLEVSERLVFIDHWFAG